MGRAAAPGRGRHRAPPNSSGHTEANHSSFSYLFEGFCTPDQVVPADIGKRPQLLQLILGETCAPPSTTPDVRPRQTVRTVAVVISEADTGSALTHVRDIRPKFPQDYGDPGRDVAAAGHRHRRRLCQEHLWELVRRLARGAGIETLGQGSMPIARLADPRRESGDFGVEFG